MRTIITVQAIFYFVTAVWPLLHIKSFEFVTGPKKENWLVYTVSVLLLGYCGSIFYGMRSENFPSPELVVLSALNALGLMLIDIIFVVRGTISKVYLGDAAAELILFILIVMNWTPM
jgi:hypothetical protein